VAQTQQSTEQTALRTTTSEAAAVADMHPAEGVPAARAGVPITNHVIREVLVLAAVSGKGRRQSTQQMLRMAPQRAAGEMPILAVALVERTAGGRNVAVVEEEAEALQLQLQLHRKRLRPRRPQRQKTERTVWFTLKTLLAVRSNIN